MFLSTLDWHQLAKIFQHRCTERLKASTDAKYKSGLLQTYRHIEDTALQSHEICVVGIKFVPPYHTNICTI